MTQINIDAPRYDQNTFNGRAKHFFVITNPINLFTSSRELDKAKIIVDDYRQGKLTNLTEDQIWKSKSLYDSAFHPDTGEKMFIFGRMSAQVPMNMTITGCMMTFYKTTPAVIFWQFFNQSFNAVVNYTNRSGKTPISKERLGVSFAAATSAAMATALLLNKSVAKLPPIVGRYVPFAAVAAANCVNIPCMRSRELSHGVPVFTEDGTMIGDSPVAARKGISQVVVSRIVMAVPGMSIPPIIMNMLEKKGTLKKIPWANAPIQVGLVGFMLVFATPLCCAIFPQKSSIKVSQLEKELQDKVNTMKNPPERVYFNKGL